MIRISTIAQKCFIALVLLTGSTYAANAQRYTFEHGKETVETAYGFEEIAAYVKIRNRTQDTLQLTWVMLENTFSASDWDMVALCDPYLCHNNIPSTFQPYFFPNATSDSVSEFKVLATPKASANRSHMKIVFWETGKEQKKDTITMAIDATRLGVVTTDYPGNIPALTVYPNPAKSILNLEFNHNENSIVNIFTTNGKLVQTEKLDNIQRKINIENLPKGMYILKATSQSGNSTVTRFSKI